MERQHYKTNKMTCAPTEDSAFSVSMRTELPIEHTTKTYQTGWMPRLIRVFAGRTGYLFVLSCVGSKIKKI